MIGRHITIPDGRRPDIARSFVDRDEGRARTYVAFKVKELRTGRLLEASCDPRELSNFFQRDTDLPHELSPAFFDPEVLAKYKADTEKYELTDHDAIRCRGMWRLRSYHVNAAGQVHAYLVDLNKLPEHEQQYWLSFNEWPKGGLAERAIYNDFKGEFDPRYDPLHSLKRKVEELDAAPPAWWKPRGNELRRVVHPPATDSVDEWANAILVSRPVGCGRDSRTGAQETRRRTWQEGRAGVAFAEAGRGMACRNGKVPYPSAAGDCATQGSPRPSIKG